MLKSGKLKLADDMIVTAQEAANKAETVFTIYDDTTETEIAKGPIGGGGADFELILEVRGFNDSMTVENELPVIVSPPRIVMTEVKRGLTIGAFFSMTNEDNISVQVDNDRPYARKKIGLEWISLTDEEKDTLFKIRYVRGGATEISGGEPQGVYYYIASLDTNLINSIINEGASALSLADNFIAKMPY